MCGKLFLLVVAYASFVHGKLYFDSNKDLDTYDEGRVTVVPKTNHFVEILKSGIQSNSKPLGHAQDDGLDDAIHDGLSVADDIYELGVKFAQEEWRSASRIGELIASNSTAYTRTAESEETRVQAALEKTAADIRNDWAQSEERNCINEAKENGRKDIGTLMKTFQAEIWRFNFEYNSTYPEFPFLLLEDVLRSEYNEKTESIKACKDRKSVEAEVEGYTRVFTDRYNSLLKTTSAVHGFFFRYKLQVSKKYREMKTNIEKICTTAFRNMRKCLKTKDDSQFLSNSW